MSSSVRTRGHVLAQKLNRTAIGTCKPIRGAPACFLAFQPCRLRSSCIIGSVFRRGLGKRVIDCGRASSGEAIVHLGVDDLLHEFSDYVVMAVLRNLNLRNGTI